MTVKQLDHLNMSVRDLSEALQWYEQIFGFVLVERGLQNGSPWAIIKSGDAMLCLYERPELEPPTESNTSAHRVNHFCLRITDVDAWKRTVEREGLDLRYGGVIDWPHSTSWYVQDPSGHEIEVASWRDDRIAFA